jgi:aminomethyltransferase
MSRANMTLLEKSEFNLRRTPLYEVHRARGGRMVPFAGYAMPVQFEGIIAEHTWTREKAGLFDVSHMGQRALVGPDHETLARALETMTPGAFAELAPGRMRYTLLLNETGGIVDDLMVTRPAADGGSARLLIVINAARKEADDSFIRERLPEDVELVAFEDRALLALQGPAAEAVMARLCPAATELVFMNAAEADVAGMACHISRSGYTGEDGFEISVAAADAARLAEALLAHEEVKPVGLGARDSLRLEAGLPLYGHDLDETTSPVEAALEFAIAKGRRAARNFPGAERIMRELEEGPSRRRVGIQPLGRAPVREGAAVLGHADAPIGIVTSGGYGPTIGGPVAMGYVANPHAAPGTQVRLAGRRGAEPAQIKAMPFVPQRYVRKKP